MADGKQSSDPLVQPRLIRTLKDRPKLINFGLREEFLDELEDRVAERRKPKNVSDKMAQQAARGAASTTNDALFPILQRRLGNRLEQFNNTLFNRL